MEWAVSAGALGLQALHGSEITLLDGRHLVLLVADARGWANLCRIITRAHRDVRGGTAADPAPPPGDEASPPPQRTRDAWSVEPPLPRPGKLREPGDPAVPLQTVLEHAEGLVCLTGCATRGVEDEPTARRLLEAFGPERLRVELQRPFLRHDRAQARARVELARRLGVRCVATGDVHAHSPMRALLQDAFVAARHHRTLEASEPLRRGNHSHVLASPQAMATRFADHPDSVLETERVAEMLDFHLNTDLGYRYPGAEDPDAQRRLVELCRARLEDRYGGDEVGAGGTKFLRQAAGTRLDEELALIDRLGLAGFFLLHHEMLVLASEVAVEVRGAGGAGGVRSLMPPGRGRGSSVSSIVCYLTGLSHVDPIANRLELGRFLNEDLRSLPDIDLDFPRDIREKLIPRVTDHFGRDRAALVASYPCFRSRGAIRELGKVLGMPPGDLERVARGAEGFLATDWSHGDRPIERPGGVAGDIAAAIGSERLKGTPPTRWAWLARLAEEARGLPRHLSQHPGGMIVATRPLIDCCPVVPAAMEGRQMAQWDKDSCADAGFLKIDLLGLGMLSAVERCVELIARTRNERIDLSRIPYDDPATYAAIQAADTVGVFQIESRAQMQSLMRTRPENLDDLVIQVAIVRPGPIQGGAVNPYIERRQRLRVDPGYRIPHLHPSLEPVLRDTLGTIIFQDQVMEVAQAFAGFTPGEADGLRRAMSRKRAGAAIDAYRQRFLEGARERAGAPEQLAIQVWEMVAGFAGFGFPKSHSAAFGLLAYQSTWLRVHYGPELLCALLNEQPMGFYAPDSLAHEAQRRGLTLLPADINASEVECTIEPLPGARDGVAIRLGLGYIKDVATVDVEALVAARVAGGPFRSLGDLAARAGNGRAALEQLAWSGACDDLAGSPGGERTSASEPASTRRTALWELGVAVPGRRVPGGTQLSLPLELPDAPALRPLDRWQQLVSEYATTGITLSGHVMAVLRPRLPAEVLTSTALLEVSHGTPVTVAGLVIARQRPGTASGIVFMLLEDETGTVNLVVPPALYERRRGLIRIEPLLLVHGRLEKLPAAGGAINVVVSEARAVESSLSAPRREREDPERAPAPVHPLGRTPDCEGDPGEDSDALRVGASMRAVAPPVMSFAAGRRR
jgi:error-prone DNA polymerase